MDLHPLLLFLHVAGVVVWVGGMFFAYVCLRPEAASQLEPPPRLRLWRGVLARFFTWVWVAVAAVLVSGLALILRYGFAAAPLYQHIARTIANDWNADGNCALVVGATFPEELKIIRGIVGDMPLLIPGVGAQGGDVEAVVKNGKTADGTGLMINSSRGILYASSGAGYAEAAADAARDLRDAINRHR